MLSKRTRHRAPLHLFTFKDVVDGVVGLFDRSLMPAALAVKREAVERWKVIEIPAGDTPGFSIDVPGSAGHKPDRRWRSEEWLSQGYCGLLVKGEGKGVSRLVPDGAESTVIFDRHHGRVRFEDLDIICGSRHGIFAGLEHRGEAPDPVFSCETSRVNVLAMRERTTWGVFYYGCRLYMEDGTVDVRNGLEHATYGHGPTGVDLRRMTLRAAAQCVKVRSDTTETMPVRGVLVNVQGCLIDSWYEPHSSRGGGGVVMEGSGAHLRVLGNIFRNLGPNGDIPASQRTRAVMVDDAKGDFWNVLDGRPGVGFANGHVLIRGNAFEVGPGNENLSPVIRVGNLAQNARHRCALSCTIEGNALYGERLQLQLSDVRPWKTSVAGNNTAAIKLLSEAFGMDTTSEALIPLRDKAIPVSQGLER